MDFDYKINKTGLTSKLFMPITNNNIIYKATQEEKIYNLGDPKLAVMPKIIKKEYIYIGIAAIILIIIVNNK